MKIICTLFSGLTCLAARSMVVMARSNIVRRKLSYAIRYRVRQLSIRFAASGGVSTGGRARAGGAEEQLRGIVCRSTFSYRAGCGDLAIDPAVVLFGRA